MLKAAELDPRYGPAWAGLGDAYCLLGAYSLMHAEDAAARARDAAVKALELAPNLGEAHSARAMVSELFDWDFAAADRGFKRALELNPAFINGAAWQYLFHVGFVCARWDEAFDGLLRLENREPLSGYVASLISLAHSTAGSPSEALRWSDRAIELEPDAFLSLWTRVQAWYRNREWAKAIDAGETALAASGRHPLALPTVATVFVESGDIDAAIAIYDEMQLRAKREPLAPMGHAMVAAAIGEHRTAVHHAREAFRIRDPQLPIYASTWPQSRFLRAIPEFQELVTSIGLPWRPAESSRAPDATQEWRPPR